VQCYQLSERTPSIYVCVFRTTVSIICRNNSVGTKSWPRRGPPRNSSTWVTLHFIDGHLWATEKKENFCNRNLQTGIKFAALIRSNDFVNIFPTSFFNDRSLEKKLCFYENKHFLCFSN
jgi:hypothetical protein